IGGQTYSANHISENYAKQKACQQFFHDMLAKEINNQSESPEMKLGENSNPKGSHSDFPWSHFASLAMDNLINQWAVKPVVT
ncbi:mediator of RNA polymerase II transcription subunit 15-like, partial [Aphis craccivora]